MNANVLHDHQSTGYAAFQIHWFQHCTFAKQMTLRCCAGCGWKSKSNCPARPRKSYTLSLLKRNLFAQFVNSQHKCPQLQTKSAIPISANVQKVQKCPNEELVPHALSQILQIEHAHILLNVMEFRNAHSYPIFRLNASTNPHNICISVGLETFYICLVHQSWHPRVPIVTASIACATFATSHLTASRLPFCRPRERKYFSSFLPTSTTMHFTTSVCGRKQKSISSNSWA